MDLVNVTENALTVELSWIDCNFLAHIIEEALSADCLGSFADRGLADGYARALVTLFLAGGMASWAHTTREDDYSVPEFRISAQVTTEERAAWEEQVRRAQARLAPANPAAD